MREIIERRDPRRVLGQFELIYWNKRRLVKAFYDAGGRDLITLGTDHPSWGEFFSAFGAHREILSLVLSGIPAQAVLRIATINGARALGVSDHLGSLEVGKLADLFVVDGNPLDDVRNTRNVRWVMRGGRHYDAAELLASVEGTLGPQGPGDEYAWRPRSNR
jgi:imidazolonepropionase-like amidohydrolase